MSRSELNEQEEVHAVDIAVETDDSADEELSKEETDLVATVAMVGVVGVGVAVFEAALLPGLALGVAAMAAPKFVPKIGSA